MTLGSRICYFLGYCKFWVWASVLCFFSSFLNMSPFRASVLVFRILDFWSVHVCHCPSVEPVCLSLGLSVCFFLYSLPSCVHHVQFCSLCIIGPDLCQLCSQVCSLVWPFVYLMSASLMHLMHLPLLAIAVSFMVCELLAFCEPWMSLGPVLLLHLFQQLKLGCLNCHMSPASGSSLCLPHACFLTVIANITN